MQKIKQKKPSKNSTSLTSFYFTIQLEESKMFILLHVELSDNNLIKQPCVYFGFKIIVTLN